MKKILLLLIFGYSLKAFPQTNELIGKWILDKTIYSDGKFLEINNPLFSSKLIYQISPNQLSINEQKFDAKYSTNHIKLEYRTLKFWREDDYLLVQEENDNKVHLFLKVDDFINKFPEFKPKTEVRNNETLTIANEIIDADFNNELNFDDFLLKNRPDHPSKSFVNLYFKAEFILTKTNKIKDIKILNSISNQFDNEVIRAIRKSEMYFVNNLNSDLLINKEMSFLKWHDDLNNPNEKELYNIILKADAYYLENNFEKAIIEYEKIKGLNIKNNRFKFMIHDANVKLGISYLATNQKEKSCSVFQSIGETDFSVRNYLIYFCK